MPDSDSVKCHGCGTEISATDAFCKTCGAWQNGVRKAPEHESRESIFEKNGWDRRYVIKMIVITLLLAGGAALLVGLLIGHAATSLSG